MDDRPSPKGLWQPGFPFPAIFLGVGDPHFWANKSVTKVWIDRETNARCFNGNQIAAENKPFMGPSQQVGLVPTRYWYYCLTFKDAS